MHRNIRKSLWVFIITICFVGKISSQLSRNQQSELSKAIGFYLGTTIYTDLIIEELPQFRQEAMLAKLNFELAHKNGFENILSRSETIFGLSRDSIQNKMVNLFYSEYKTNSLSIKEAKIFLQTFESERIKGDSGIYNGFVKTLLGENTRYISNPYYEFEDGFYYDYSTKDHPKSKGIDIAMKIPKSWTKKSGRRPNIIDVFESYDEKARLSVAVKDLKSNLIEEYGELSIEDLNYINSSEYEKDMIESFDEDLCKSFLQHSRVDKIENFNFKRINVDGQPAMDISGILEIEVMGTRGRNYCNSIVIVYKHYLINIFSTIEIENSNLIIEKYKPLLNIIQLTSIINNKWINR